MGRGGHRRGPSAQSGFVFPIHATSYLLSLGRPTGVRRNPWRWPLNVPVPTISSALLIPTAFLSDQPGTVIRVFRSVGAIVPSGCCLMEQLRLQHQGSGGHCLRRPLLHRLWHTRRSAYPPRVGEKQHPGQRKPYVPPLAVGGGGIAGDLADIVNTQRHREGAAGGVAVGNAPSDRQMTQCVCPSGVRAFPTMSPASLIASAKALPPPSVGEY